ncbi:hypothetical protein ACEWY4_020382 [Coilia grayii]|uniref:CUB domain-containing protein 1-like n=1 Tax=Coilia grayii TaxID=363190 RepID=A0ABD1JDP3_9TELE
MVCVEEDGEKSCQPETVLSNAGQVPVTFGCTAPWEIFTVEIRKRLECETKPCQHAVIPEDSEPLFQFNRTFHWCLRAPVRMTFHVAFSNTGLTQIRPLDTCPDGHTYNLVALESTKNVHLGSFCASGTITGVQILNGGKVVLTVLGRKKLEPQAFDVYWGDDIKSLAVVNVKLPKGQSSQEFFSANYPSSFPDDDLMTWSFDVPRFHDTTVKFLQHSEPHCRKKEPAVVYEQNGQRVVRKLSDAQLTGEQGSFTVTLLNCEMDVVRSRAEALGLMLQFRVSAIRTGSEVLCQVDFTQENSLSLRIAKKTTDSTCNLKLEGVSQNSVIVPPGKKSTLSFKNCPEEDLLLTVNKTIACKRLEDCPHSPVPLTVPALERCLPESLKTIHWNLLAPEHGTVELWAYSGTLHQSLPGQECNGSVEFRVSEADGTPIGEFCPTGVISKILVHGNITVTASPRREPFLSETFQTFFKVFFTEEIRETYIFMIKPERDTPSLLASPGWPGGMKPYSTASWITHFPEKLDAHLTFTKVSQPKCAHRHTSIQVQTLGSQEEMYSRQEDEEGDSEITIHESFYLNMSNCHPERGSFSAMWETKLKRHRRVILPIVLAVVGVLFLGSIIALVAICVVVRKKKQEMAHEVARGVYNPNGHSFLPGLPGPPKTVEDDDTHIYDYIEDTLVYGHLLRDDEDTDRYGEPVATDTYRPFNGPTTEATPLKDMTALKEHNGEGEPEVAVYRPFVTPPEATPPTAQENQNFHTRHTGVEGGEGRSTPEPLSPCSEALQVQQVPVDV